jgi:hypothetical protein
MYTINFLADRGRPACRAEHLTANCEPISWKIWDFLLLTTVWTSTTCYKKYIIFLLKTPWLVKSEVYRQRTVAGQQTLLPTFADGAVSLGQRGGSPTVVNLSFLDGSRWFFFQVAPHLSSRVWVDHVLDPLLLRKSSSAGNQTQKLWVCSQALWSLDHRGGHFFYLIKISLQVSVRTFYSLEFRILRFMLFVTCYNFLR